MGVDYSYSQPSQDESYGHYSGDSGCSEIEAAIQMDQAEIDAARRQYPPQPEVEFGFPKECYCGGEPLLATSYTATDPGRRFYTCQNRDDGDCHVWKWWDVAVMEEMRDMGTQSRLLCEKVDSLSCVTEYETCLNQVKDLHYETEQKVLRLEKIVSELGKKNGFEIIVCVMVFVVLIIGMVLMYK